MQAKLIPIARLVPAPWNANRVPPATMAKIRRSLEQFGIVENLVARPSPEQPDKFEVISGNHRLMLMQELGVAKVPVVVLEIDNARARLLAQTLNRTRGQDDPLAYARLLEEVLAELGREDGLAEALALLPETETSLEQALFQLRGEPPAPADDAVPPLPEKPTSKPGTVYELGPHRLLCGDVTEPGALQKLIGDEQVEVLWTDPPYGVGYVGGGRAEKEGTQRVAIRNDSAKDVRQLLDSAFAACDQVLAPNARFYIAAPPGSLQFRLAIEQVGWRFHEALVWVKDVFVLGHSDYHYRHEEVIYGWKPGDGRPGRGKHAGSCWYGDHKQSTVFEIARPKRSDQHPTMKPVELIASQLRNSAKTGDLVLDCFAGSGSTMVACEQLGLRARLVELDPGYCDVIRKRYSDYSG